MKFKRGREERHSQAVADEEYLHRHWVIRIQEIIRDTGLSAEEAVVKLKKEYEESLGSYKPTCLAQVKAAWLSFNRRIEQAKK